MFYMHSSSRVDPWFYQDLNLAFNCSQLRWWCNWTMICQALMLLNKWGCCLVQQCMWFVDSNFNHKSYKTLKLKSG